MRYPSKVVYADASSASCSIFRVRLFGPEVQGVLIKHATIGLAARC